MFFFEANPQDLPINKIENIICYNQLNYKQNDFVILKKNITNQLKLKKSSQNFPAYKDLNRTEDDERKITDIVTTIGTLGKINLLLYHEKRLRKLGEELRYSVHPFKFIGFIFSNPTLKGYMKEVFNDYFKRVNFVKDFAKTMNHFYSKNLIKIYIDDFSNEVNVPIHKINPYIDKKDWEGLLKMLIRN